MMAVVWLDSLICCYVVFEVLPLLGRAALLAGAGAAGGAAAGLAHATGARIVSKQTPVVIVMRGDEIVS
jgi:glycerate kinase